ncbi:MAG: hypothetical protein E7547_05095 [Ruminococcaceae bacterium]|nr:hypothetical protein [Oscillospiraceae bacterium]
MKKTYIVPQSRLFCLKMKENIADSYGQVDDSTSGTFVISFTHAVDPCRTYYSGMTTAINTKGDEAPFNDYFHELEAIGAWKCFRMV